MEVQFLTYNKKQYPIRIGYRASKKFFEEKGYEFGQNIKRDKQGNIIDAGDPADQEILLFYGLESGHHAVNGNVNMPLKREDMEFVLDECFVEFIKLIREFRMSVEKEVPEGGPEGNLPQNRKQRRQQDKVRQ